MNEELNLRRPNWAQLEKDRRVVVDSAMEWCGLTSDSWQWFQEITNIIDFDSQVDRLPQIFASMTVKNPNVDEALIMLGGSQLSFLAKTTDPVAVFSSRELSEEHTRAVTEGRLADFYSKDDILDTWDHEMAHLKASHGFGIRGFVVFATIIGGNYDGGRVAVTLQNMNDLRVKVENGSNLAYVFGRVLAAPALANIYNYTIENEQAAVLLSAAKRQGVKLTGEEEEFISLLKMPEVLDLTEGVFVNQD